MGRFAAGTELVTDYMLPAGLRDAAGDTFVELVSAVAAQRGEPWLTFLAPGDMTALLEGAGLGAVRHVRQRDSVTPELWQRSDALRPQELSMLTRATAGPSREETGHPSGPDHGARPGGRLVDRVPVTVEPGIYLPGPGGVRIEDTLVARAGAGTAAPRTFSPLPPGK